MFRRRGKQKDHVSFTRMSALRHRISIQGYQAGDQEEGQYLLSLSKALSGKGISLYSCRRDIAACPVYRSQYLFTDQNDKSQSVAAVRGNARIFVDHLYHHSLFHQIQKE